MERRVPSDKHCPQMQREEVRELTTGFGGVEIMGALGKSRFRAEKRIKV